MKLIGKISHWIIVIMIMTTRIGVLAGKNAGVVAGLDSQGSSSTTSRDSSTTPRDTSYANEDIDDDDDKMEELRGFHLDNAFILRSGREPPCNSICQKQESIIEEYYNGMLDINT